MVTSKKARIKFPHDKSKKNVVGHNFPVIGRSGPPYTATITAKLKKGGQHKYQGQLVRGPSSKKPWVFVFRGVAFDEYALEVSVDGQPEHTIQIKVVDRQHGVRILTNSTTPTFPAGDTCCPADVTAYGGKNQDADVEYATIDSADSDSGIFDLGDFWCASWVGLADLSTFTLKFKETTYDEVSATFSTDADFC